MASASRLTSGCTLDLTWWSTAHARICRQARARYQSALLPVCLQVSPEILRQRLENRGRENASEINARLARAARYTPQDCLTLNNDGSMRQSVDKLLTLIHQKEKHHAWLVSFARLRSTTPTQFTR